MEGRPTAQHHAAYLLKGRHGGSKKLAMVKLKRKTPRSVGMARRIVPRKRMGNDTM